jgi:sn-glycerol 3-phosphate transport system permease protein
MIRKIIVYLLLILSALALSFPILFAIVASFLSSEELHSGKYIPSSFSFINYIQAFTSVPLLKFLINSFIVSFTVMMGQLIICSLAAFAIVYIPFRGRNFFFYLFLSTMLIPWEATMIPNYITVLNVGWMNTYMGLTIPFLALAFGVFLLRQHFMTIPREIYESSQIDGCSRFRFFTYFVLPLSKPSLIALAIYGFLTTWNMYLWPLLVTTNEQVRTVQIGIKMMIAQEASTSWNMVMAGVVIILLPTLLILFFGLHHVRRGLMSGSIKG